MKKTHIQVIFYVLLTSIFFLQGCSLDKKFVQQDISSLSPLTVVRYDTPSVGRQSFGQVLTGATVGVLLGGGVGASAILDSTSKSGGKEAQKNIYQYDLGYLIMTQFCDRARKEIPNWPAIKIIDEPVKSDYKQEGPILIFEVEKLVYGFVSSKFWSMVTVKLKDSNGDTLWHRRYSYGASYFGREYSADQYEADNAKLLKEEIVFAADKTSSDFIEHFKGEK